jgi:hypothetical protein
LKLRSAYKKVERSIKLMPIYNSRNWGLPCEIEIQTQPLRSNHSCHNWTNVTLTCAKNRCIGITINVIEWPCFLKNGLGN